MRAFDQAKEIAYWRILNPRSCARQGIVRKERALEELFIDTGRVNIPEDVGGWQRNLTPLPRE